MMRHALVTGGAGFIGSHLVEKLLCNGWKVRILDNFSTGSMENLASFYQEIDILHGDIRDREICRQACAQIDTVFHMAAISSVAASVENPVLSHDVTLGGTLNMLLAAVKEKVRRFVYSSSASVYGNAEVVPTPENYPLDPQSPYASDKAAAEYYCRNFYALYGLETVMLRYFNVFGPRQNIKSGYAAVIPCFMKAAQEQTALTIYGDGLQTRDFVFVTNIADANLKAALSQDGIGQAFNIAGGESVSLLELVRVIQGVMGRKLTIAFHPSRPGEVRHSYADITAAERILHYRPDVDLSTGLSQMR